MKRMGLVLAFFLVLMGATLIAPAMALPTHRIYCSHFTAEQIGMGGSPGPNFANYIVYDNIQITKGVLGWGMISLWICPNSPPSTPDLQGSTSSVINTIMNLSNGKGWIEYQMTWTFTGGTFQGMIVGNLLGPPGNQPPTAYGSPNLYGVLKGTGIFEGKAAIFIGTRSVGQPFSWTGTIVSA
jgi:hypothetical protein